MPLKARKERNVRRAWGSSAAAVALACVLAAPAHAGAKGRRNTAAVLGAAAAYEAIQGHGTSALVLGAGTVAAYSRYRDARDQEKSEELGSCHALGLTRTSSATALAGASS